MPDKSKLTRNRKSNYKNMNVLESSITMTNMACLVPGSQLTKTKMLGTQLRNLRFNIAGGESPSQRSECGKSTQAKLTRLKPASTQTTAKFIKPFVMEGNFNFVPMSPSETAKQRRGRPVKSYLRSEWKPETTALSPKDSKPQKSQSNKNLQTEDLLEMYLQPELKLAKTSSAKPSDVVSNPQSIQLIEDRKIHLKSDSKFDPSKVATEEENSKSIQNIKDLLKLNLQTESQLELHLPTRSKSKTVYDVSRTVGGILKSFRQTNTKPEYIPLSKAEANVPELLTSEAEKQELKSTTSPQPLLITNLVHSKPRGQKQTTAPSTNTKATQIKTFESMKANVASEEEDDDDDDDEYEDAETEQVAAPKKTPVAKAEVEEEDYDYEENRTPAPPFKPTTTINGVPVVDLEPKVRQNIVDISEAVEINTYSPPVNLDVPLKSPPPPPPPETILKAASRIEKTFKIRSEKCQLRKSVCSFQFYSPCIKRSNKSPKVSESDKLPSSETKKPSGSIKVFRLLTETPEDKEEKSITKVKTLEEKENSEYDVKQFLRPAITEFILEYLVYRCSKSSRSMGSPIGVIVGIVLGTITSSQSFFPDRDEHFLRVLLFDPKDQDHLNHRQRILNNRDLVEIFIPDEVICNLYADIYGGYIIAGNSRLSLNSQSLEKLTKADNSYQPKPTSGQFLSEGDSGQVSVIISNDAVSYYHLE